MSQELMLDKLTDAELKFLEDRELKTWDFFEPDEYYADCPYCHNPFLHVYIRPTVVASTDVKFNKLYCYCNECQITGPLHSIRKNPSYTPPEGIKKFIYECQCFYNNNVAEIALKSIPKRKNFPNMKLLNKIGIEVLDNDVLKEFAGVIGYTTRADIQRFNKNAHVNINQKLPYKIPKDTWGLVLPFGPRPGFHVGFVIIYDGIDDVEMYTVRDTFYTANGRDNYIFFNCIINYECDDYDTIKEGGAAFLDRKDEENGKEWGISVLVTDYLDPIDLAKQTRKIVKNRFGEDAYERSKFKKPVKKTSTKNAKTSKRMAKRESPKQND